MTSSPSPPPDLETSTSPAWLAPVIMSSTICGVVLLVGVGIVVTKRMCRRGGPQPAPKLHSSVAPVESDGLAPPDGLQATGKPNYHQAVFDPEYLESVAESVTPRHHTDLTTITELPECDSDAQIMRPSASVDDSTSMRSRGTAGLAGIRTRNRRPSLLKEYISHEPSSQSGADGDCVVNTIVEAVTENETSEDARSVDSENLYERRRSSLKPAEVGGSRRLPPLAEIRSRSRRRSLETGNMGDGSKSARRYSQASASARSDGER